MYQNKFLNINILMHIIRLRKGLNIPLQGLALKSIQPYIDPKSVAIKPSDFVGFVPKLLVTTGDQVQAGTPIISHKVDPRIQIVSPISGTVSEFIRGEKRVIEEIRIIPDNKNSSVKFEPGKLKFADSKEIVDMLLSAGIWPLIRQRPYDIIPNPDVQPRDIFISSFDSSPLAPDFNFILKGKEKYLQDAINLLKNLTSGNVYLGINAAAESNEVFESLLNVEKKYFRGPHPAGNVGVHIHHIKPINKGETVWYLNIQSLLIIGKFLATGSFDAKQTIVVTGPEAKNPKYFETVIGAEISAFAEPVDPKKNVRFISGNVLTGTKIKNTGYLGYYHNQITLIPEGDYYEFMGWASPGFKKYSFSNTFLSKLIPQRSYKFDSNYHGGERAFVMTGEYEKVFPFKIYPVYLLKAILANDIEKMEKLGIYEVSAEDFALCEYICTSKIEAQEIVKNGLENLRKEMN